MREPPCPDCGRGLPAEAIERQLSDQDKRLEMIISCGACGAILSYRNYAVRPLTPNELFVAVLEIPTLAAAVTQDGRVAVLDNVPPGTCIDRREPQ